ncbi:MAG: gamma-glutamylcyclotransferase family protein [Clostridiaceae bacterium]
MKNTFYRPAEINTRNLNQIIREMRENVTELLSGTVDKDEVVRYTRKLIEDGKPLPKNPAMVFWGFAEPETMPSDSRVIYFYTPSYIAVSILAYVKMYGPDEATKLEGFEETLKKGLLGATGRGFTGAGHDTLIGLIHSMDIFASAHLHEFVEKYPEVCPEFTTMFKKAKSFLEAKVQSGVLKSDYGEDYIKEASAVIQKMKVKDKDTVIFVYGTLLRGNHNHEYYLGSSRYLGQGRLSGYALYDLGSYPGVKQKDGDFVKGEVYAIDAETLAKINHLEGEGSLYSLKREAIVMEGQTLSNVGVYVYLHEVDEKDYVEPNMQPWGKNNRDISNLVWYAAYGSNMLQERMMCYINGGSFRNQKSGHKPCTDTTAPRAKMAYEIPYDMYYGNRSGSWDEMGVSFLDASKPGKAYGVAYLISKEQFEHLYREENGGYEPGVNSKWYNCKLQLGTFSRIPVMTVTNRNVLQKNKAGQRYLQVLMEGLKENYPNLCDEEIEDYVNSRNS